MKLRTKQSGASANCRIYQNENEDPDDFQSDVFTNIEFQESYNGTMPFLTCVGSGWKDNKQKDNFIKKYKGALEERMKTSTVNEWLSDKVLQRSVYYIEDGVTVGLITGEDELKPLKWVKRRNRK